MNRLSRSAAPGFTRAGLAGGALAVSIVALLLVPWWNLRVHWASNPLYEYGWFVPVLALYLLWVAWIERPTVAAHSEGRAGRALALAAALAAALALFPLRIVQEANPDWRRMDWALSLLVVLACLSLVFATGGRPWLRQFAFPIIFLLVAVPWPMNLERGVTQGAMSFVTLASADLLWWLGHPTVLSGNEIVTGPGPVGVGEACSGIRSLHTALMFALFCGEYFRLRWGARLVLVAVGLLVVFPLNIVRTTVSVLVVIAANDLAALDHWHDPLGFAALALILAIIFALGLVLKGRGSGRVGTEANLASGAMCGSPVASRAARPPPVWLTLALIAWVSCVEVLKEGWYRSREVGLAPPIRWSIAPAPDWTDLRRIEIPDEVRGNLRCSSAVGWTWTRVDRAQWTAEFIEFGPGTSPANTPDVHKPEACLGGRGHRLLAEFPVLIHEKAGVRFPLQHYLFDVRGRPLHLFRAFVREIPAGIDPARFDLSLKGRFGAALLGVRMKRAGLVSLVTQYPYSEAEAKRVAAEILDAAIVPGAGATPAR